MKLTGFKNHDWFLTLAISFLLVIGLVVIYSATFTAKTPIEGAGTINRQLVFVILGFFIYFAFSNIDPIYYRYLPIQLLIFVFTVGLLLYVWLLGDPIHGTTRWIEWGFVRIQPSEYTKVALILLNSSILADILQKKFTQEVDWGSGEQLNLRSKITIFFKNFTAFNPVFLSYALAGIVSGICVVLIFVEPAIGNATITAMIFLSLCLMSFPKQEKLVTTIIIFLMGLNVFSGLINLKFIYDKVGFSLIVENIDIAILFLSIIIGVILTYLSRLKFPFVILIIALSFLSFNLIAFAWDNYLSQNQRIVIFFNPEKDPTGSGWQLRQSKIAIGSGRIFGKGFLQGSQSKLRYLPEAYNDFIFATFCEEFGLLGAVFLLVLYAFLISRIIISAKAAQSNYEALICFGVAVMILIHVFINMGMNIGILPITGIPLPLISYGGSSIMVTMIALGIVQAVNMHKDTVDMQESLVITSES
ncbi:rod shape-determining protein RodA [Candidatus Dojkabacteria bacterium]|nr:rod shape-determining protein RodA [Candidatus Dojkabacteria bacterium]